MTGSIHSVGRCRCLLGLSSRSRTSTLRYLYSYDLPVLYAYILMALVVIRKWITRVMRWCVILRQSRFDRPFDSWSFH